MIIKAVWLYNIRSYKNEIIVFPEEGITVIYGDVGSGKSSILNAIGFALFGNVPGASSDPLARFAYPTARDLLRRGETSGFIRLWIKSGRKNIVIHRSIQETGKTVSDKGGWVLVVDEKGKLAFKSLTAMEMRGYILELLGIPEEKTKARSRVFASAIYVPQFAIHSILGIDNKERSEIINRVLNLLKYSLAKNRIENLKRTIKRRIEREFKVKEKDLLKDISKEKPYKEKLEELNKKLIIYKEKLLNLSTEMKEKELEKLKLEKQKEKAYVKLSRLKAYFERLEELKKQEGQLSKELENKNPEEILNEILQKKEELETIANKLSEINSVMKNIMEELEETQKKQENRLKIKEKLLRQHQKIQGEISELEKRFKEILDLEKKGICPICLQKVSHAHAQQVKEDIEKNIKTLKAKEEELNTKLKPIEEEIITIKSKIIELNSKRGELENKHNELFKKYTELNNELNKLILLKNKAEQLNKIRSEIEKLTEKTSEYETIEEELETISKKIENMEQEIKRLNEEYVKTEKNRGKAEGEIKSINEFLKQIAEKKTELENIRKEILNHYKYLDFISKYVVSVINEVERYVKLRAYNAFREEFLRIFKTLMLGYENLDIEIKPDFTPIFKAKVDGVLVPIESPSGGQLTSVSLAYRLALNRVARSMIPQLSEGLLILDEPTYGFSPERVELLRKVLFSSKGPRQVIVVTHDKTFYETSGEEKLSTIRLELDISTTTTKTYYENIDEKYIKDVKETFKKLRRGLEKYLSEPKIKLKETFEPIIKSSSKDVQYKGLKKSKSIFDYL